ncbi:uncharacterized protein LOC132053805 [Lycium ferocissimum]|uniref:uncharacterized protein LOC132053805 n=1 Tax=Lycium ferocissimum TaxID=112874 RepID=UPI0028159393|nr:uncharacterized protein LOC132053805 [Lycium ferocissimum]
MSSILIVLLKSIVKIQMMNWMWILNSGVDLPTRRKSNKLRYDPDCVVSIFELGMVFENAEVFRKAVANYAVEYHVQLKLKPNEQKKVRCRCKSKICNWRLYASVDKKSGDFMVKTYHPIHKCTPLNKNKMCNAKFISNVFRDRITSQPTIRIWEIQDLVRDQLGLYVGRTICHRAKQIVLNKFMGDWKEEFARICDYAEQIILSNPGNTCIVKTDRESQPGVNLFKYFYVCFDAMKRGWLEGCRKIIGFDGCFLKGACKGELLVVVGKNGNQQMFPIAWAVIDNESKESWTWFIQNLINDLGLGIGDGITVMSDMQKGLLSTLLNLLPNAEHRKCARHIWANWQKDWKGEERRKQFWRVSKASFEVKLKDELTKLDKLGKDICEDLLQFNKEHWCRAYFREHSNCDVVENNMCETFNSWILAARHKSIITMLEEIRHKVMTRHVEMRRFAETWITDISPMARVMLEENKKLSNKCEVLWNGLEGFEIKEYEYRFIVHLWNKTCTCRLWQLRGIPCQHAICAFYHLGDEPYNHVEHWYRKETFMKAYSYFLDPLPNMKMWPKTNNMKIEPPAPKVMPGRPKKKRRKDKDEPRKKYGKLSKKGVQMTCSTCHQLGHNKKSCPVTKGGSGRGSGQSSSAQKMPRGSGESSSAQKRPTGSGESVGLKRGRGSGQSSSAQKRPKNASLGCYINPTTGRTVINPVVQVREL